MADIGENEALMPVGDGHVPAGRGRHPEVGAGGDDIVPVGEVVGHRPAGGVPSVTASKRLRTRVSRASQAFSPCSDAARQCR